MCMLCSAGCPEDHRERRCFSDFINVVSWELETFYFSFQHFYMHPFYESVLVPALSFVLNSLLSMGIFLWFYSMNPRGCHRLQPKSPFAEMMAASLWKLLSFCNIGNAPALNVGRHSFCAHAVVLQASKDTSVLLARRTNYLLSFKNLLHRFSSWSPDDSFVLFFSPQVSRHVLHRKINFKHSSTISARDLGCVCVNGMARTRPGTIAADMFLTELMAL